MAWLDNKIFDSGHFFCWALFPDVCPQITNMCTDRQWMKECDASSIRLNEHFLLFVHLRISMNIYFPVALVGVPVHFKPHIEWTIGRKKRESEQKTQCQSVRLKKHTQQCEMQTIWFCVNGGQKKEINCCLGVICNAIERERVEVQMKKTGRVYGFFFCQRLIRI